MFEFISLILVLVGLFSERVDVLFVAALFAFISNVDISININKEDKHDDG